MRILFHILLLFLLPFAATGRETVALAAASNFIPALRQIERQIESRFDDDLDLRLSFGSSGNFSRQIAQGAPFDIFISANAEYIARLERRGVAVVERALFARGRIGVYAPAGSVLATREDSLSLWDALRGGEFARLAIPNPEHAPYGVAARQALRHGGVDSARTKRVIAAENAAQAMQYCRTGNVDACIAPTSFIIAAAGDGKAFSIPDDWHAPIKQHIALLSESAASRRVFHALLSAQTKKTLRDFGYHTTAATDETTTRAPRRPAKQTSEQTTD